MFLCLSPEARINTSLSPTMGFFNESDSLATYFAILGELSSSNFKFSLIISWLFQRARKDIPRSFLTFYLAQEDQISEE